MTRTEVDILLRARDQASSEIGKASHSLDALGGTAQRMGTGMVKSLAASLAGVFALQKGIQAAFAATAYAAQVRSMETAFGSITRAAGLAADRVLAEMKRASGGTITQLKAMEAANRAALLGLPLDKLGELMKIARASATATGQSIEAMFNDIVTGVGRASPMILDNLGITVRLEEATRKYAESVGTTAEKLTEAQRKQAILHAVLEKGDEIFRKVGAAAAALTDPQKFEAMRSSIADLTGELGRGLLPLTTRIAEQIGRWASGLAESLRYAREVREANAALAAGTATLEQQKKVFEDIVNRYAAQQRMDPKRRWMEEFDPLGWALGQARPVGPEQAEAARQMLLWINKAIEAEKALGAAKRAENEQAAAQIAAAAALAAAREEAYRKGAAAIRDFLEGQRTEIQKTVDLIRHFEQFRWAAGSRLEDTRQLALERLRAQLAELERAPAAALADAVIGGSQTALDRLEAQLLQLRGYLATGDVIDPLRAQLLEAAAILEQQIREAVLRGFEAIPDAIRGMPTLDAAIGGLMTEHFARLGGGEAAALWGPLGPDLLTRGLNDFLAREDAMREKWADREWNLYQQQRAAAVPMLATSGAAAYRPGAGEPAAGEPAAGGGAAALGRVLGVLGTVAERLLGWVDGLVRASAPLTVALAAFNEAIMVVINAAVVPLVNGLIPLLNLIGQIVTGVGPLLAALFASLGQILAALLPVFVVLGQILAEVLKLLAAIAPFLVVLFQLLAQMILPVLKILAPILSLVTGIFTALTPIIGFFARVVDAASRPIEFLADVVSFVVRVFLTLGHNLGVFVYNLVHWFRPRRYEAMPTFSSTAFTRPLVDINKIGAQATAAATAAAANIPAWSTPDYAPAGTPGYGTTAPTGVGSSTTIARQPDIYVYQYFQGPVVGVGGLRQVAELVVDALEEHAGLGGRVHIKEAIAPVRG